MPYQRLDKVAVDGKEKVGREGLDVSAMEAMLYEIRRPPPKKGILFRNGKCDAQRIKKRANEVTVYHRELEQIGKKRKEWMSLFVPPRKS